MGLDQFCKINEIVKWTNFEINIKNEIMWVIWRLQDSRGWEKKMRGVLRFKRKIARFKSKIERNNPVIVEIRGGYRVCSTILENRRENSNKRKVG